MTRLPTPYFVPPGSIVREIWGKSDTILFIFAGAAAEFAVNKAVDWLYFTGKLPADPIGRLFTTVSYAREIVFADNASALATIDRINAVHKSVERARGAKIPGWAFRDVLFMLIDYSVRAYELLERKLSKAEKKAVFEVFVRMGTRMNIPDLPNTYAGYLEMRSTHLQQHLAYSAYTHDLYQQYKRSLGSTRYRIVLHIQAKLVPGMVHALLFKPRLSALLPVITLYQWSKKLHLHHLVKSLLLPKAYRAEIKALDNLQQLTGKCPFSGMNYIT